jgi:predicted RNase H-like nuclease (RuvC/YqgF family)
MITEIGLAALAVSPVIGLMISGEIRTKKDAYESAFREGEKYGSELAMLTARITIKSLQRKNKNLVDELDGVQSRLDDLQMELNELRLTNESNKLLCNENMSLRSDISRLSDKLSDARRELRKHAEAHPTAEAYMACMNWGVRH